MAAPQGKSAGHIADPVEGWKAIAARVSKRTGLDISLAAVIRLSKRGHDPLPVRRWGTARPRVVADGAELGAWVDRQWRPSSDGVPSTVAADPSDDAGEGRDGSR